MKKLILFLVVSTVLVCVYIFFLEPEEPVLEDTSNQQVKRKSSEEPTSEPTSEDKEYEHITLDSIHLQLESMKSDFQEGEVAKETARSMKMDFEILKENKFYPLEMDDAITVLERNDNELTQETVKELYQIVDEVYDAERDYFEEHNMIRDSSTTKSRAE